MMSQKRHTLEDLREAEQKARDGGSNRGNNPGRAARESREAHARVAEIRAALIEQGDLQPPQKSAATLEHERIVSELDRRYPDAKSKLIVEFEGAKYQRAYWPADVSRSRKTVKAWTATWVKLPDAK